jgi:hypothetical protein
MRAQHQQHRRGLGALIENVKASMNQHGGSLRLCMKLSFQAVRSSLASGWLPDYVQHPDGGVSVPRLREAVVELTVA